MIKEVRVYMLVSGLVQGVFFRDGIQRKALELGLTGWVKNLTDGKVEIIAEGEKERVEELVEWTEEGPVTAKVDNLEVGWQEYTGEFDSFKIEH